MSISSINTDLSLPPFSSPWECWCGVPPILIPPPPPPAAYSCSWMEKDQKFVISRELLFTKLKSQCFPRDTPLDLILWYLAWAWSYWTPHIHLELHFFFNPIADGRDGVGDVRYKIINSWHHVFQAVLDCRRGPCVQFSENGGVSTFYLKTTRVFLFPNKELYWLWFPLQ